MTSSTANTSPVSFVSNVLSGKGLIGEGYYKYLYPANHKLRSFPLPQAQEGENVAPITSYLDRITKMDHYCMPGDPETGLHRYSKPVRAVARFAFTLLILPLVGTAGTIYNAYKYAEASSSTQKKDENPSQPASTNKAAIQVNKAHEYSRAFLHDLQHAAPLLGTLTCGAATYAVTTIKMASALAFAPAIMTAVVVSIVATSVFAMTCSKIAAHNAWNPTDFAYTYILNPSHHVNKSHLHFSLLLRQLGWVESVEGGGKLLPPLSSDKVSFEKTKKVMVENDVNSSAPTFGGAYSKYSEIIDQTDYILTTEIMKALYIESCYGNGRATVQEAFLANPTNANTIADLLEEYITPTMNDGDKAYIKKTAEDVRQGNRQLERTIKLRSQILDQVCGPDWNSTDLPTNKIERKVQGCIGLLNERINKESEKVQGENDTESHVLELLKQILQKAQAIESFVTGKTTAIPDLSADEKNFLRHTNQSNLTGFSIPSTNLSLFDFDKVDAGAATQGKK